MPITPLSIPEAALNAVSTATVVAEDPIIEAVDDGSPRRYVMLHNRSVCELIVNAIACIVENEPNAGEMPASELVKRLASHFGDATVYEPVGVQLARNADVAYRAAAKRRLGQTGGSIDLVAVAEKMWKPKTVLSTVQQSFEIG